MPEEVLAALDTEFSISSPRKHGWDTVDAIRAMNAGKASFFMAMGGNFIQASPDTAATETALRQCELTVQVSTKLNHSHVVHGQTTIIIPTLGRTDIDVHAGGKQLRSEEHTSELQSLMRISYAVFCLK